jgi:hypothetical protein
VDYEVAPFGALPPRLVRGKEMKAHPAPAKKHGRRSVGCLTIESDVHANNTLRVMRGLDPRIPMRDAQPCFPERDGRDKPGHDEMKE